MEQLNELLKDECRILFCVSVFGMQSRAGERMSVQHIPFAVRNQCFQIGGADINSNKVFTHVVVSVLVVSNQ